MGYIFLRFKKILLEIYLLCQLHSWVTVIPVSEALPHKTPPFTPCLCFLPIQFFSVEFTYPQWIKIHFDTFFFE